MQDPTKKPDGITSGYGLIYAMHANGEIDEETRDRMLREHPATAKTENE